MRAHSILRLTAGRPQGVTLSRELRTERARAGSPFCPATAAAGAAIRVRRALDACAQRVLRRVARAGWLTSWRTLVAVSRSEACTLPDTTTVQPVPLTRYVCCGHAHSVFLCTGARVTLISLQIVALAGLVWNPPTSCAWAARVYVTNAAAWKHGVKVSRLLCTRCCVFHRLTSVA